MPKIEDALDDFNAAIDAEAALGQPQQVADLVNSLGFVQTAPAFGIAGGVLGMLVGAAHDLGLTSQQLETMLELAIRDIEDDDAELEQRDDAVALIAAMLGHGPGCADAERLAMTFLLYWDATLTALWLCHREADTITRGQLHDDCRQLILFVARGIYPVADRLKRGPQSGGR